MMTSSSGNLLFTVGVALLLRYCASYVVGDVIVNTRYGRVRGRRVHKDYGLGQGLICICICMYYYAYIIILCDDFNDCDAIKLYRTLYTGFFPLYC